jgi:hypothetical protein
MEPDPQALNSQNADVATRLSLTIAKPELISVNRGHVNVLETNVGAAEGAVLGGVVGVAATLVMARTVPSLAEMYKYPLLSIAGEETILKPDKARLPMVVPVLGSSAKMVPDEVAQYMALLDPTAKLE